MSSPFGDRPFPQAALIGAGLLLSATLLLVSMNEVTDSRPTSQTVDQLAFRDLRFEDGPDGSIVVYDVAAGELIETVAAGGDGFVRATLRGLARDRKIAGLGPEAPFRLAAWADGRLTLEDPVTGRFVELTGFGQTNAHAFGRLLATEASRS